MADKLKDSPLLGQDSHGPALSEGARAFGSNILHSSGGRASGKFSGGGLSGVSELERSAMAAKLAGTAGSGVDSPVNLTGSTNLNLVVQHTQSGGAAGTASGTLGQSGGGPASLALAGLTSSAPLGAGQFRGMRDGAVAIGDSEAGGGGTQLSLPGSRANAPRKSVHMTLKAKQAALNGGMGGIIREGDEEEEAEVEKSAGKGASSEREKAEEAAEAAKRDKELNEKLEKALGVSGGAGAGASNREGEHKASSGNSASDEKTEQRKDDSPSTGASAGTSRRRSSNFGSQELQRLQAHREVDRKNSK